MVSEDLYAGFSVRVVCEFEMKFLDSKFSEEFVNNIHEVFVSNFTPHFQLFFPILRIIWKGVTLK